MSRIKTRSMVQAAAMIVVAFLLNLSSTAVASWIVNEGMCIQYPTGDGSCSGTFAYFRSLPGQFTSAVFMTFPNYGSFYANIDGQKVYSCAMTSASPQTVHDMWTTNTANRDYFDIHWNSSGVCTSLAIMHGSPFSPY
jgi:hypothetical protein